MPIVITLLAGVLGTALGGALAGAWPGIGKRAMARLLHFTSGLMLAIVCFELVPEAVDTNMPAAVCGLFVGMAAMLLSDAMLAGDRQSARRTGLLVGLGIALHNFPEGLAVGAGYAGAPRLGMALCLAIALHDVPEGVAMALPLRAGGMGKGRILLLATLAGLPTMVGAAAGMLVGGVSAGALAFCLALAGGAMLQITCQNLLPEAQREHQGRLESLLMALGVVAGGAICYLVV